MGIFKNWVTLVDENVATGVINSGGPVISVPKSPIQKFLKRSSILRFAW
jgi:hypothetical protein